MPHPERSFLSWQWPDNCNNLKLEKPINDDNPKFSPWIKMFQNVFYWVLNHQN